MSSSPEEKSVILDGKSKFQHVLRLVEHSLERSPVATLLSGVFAVVGLIFVGLGMAHGFGRGDSGSLGLGGMSLAGALLLLPGRTSEIIPLIENRNWPVAWANHKAPIVGSAAAVIGVHFIAQGLGLGAGWTIFGLLALGIWVARSMGYKPDKTKIMTLLSAKTPDSRPGVVEPKPYSSANSERPNDSWRSRVELDQPDYGDRTDQMIQQINDDEIGVGESVAITKIAVVPYRNVTHELANLGMRCDAGEMPHPFGGEVADSYFVGVASLVADEIKQDGLFALFLFNSQLGLILAPTDPEQPACWISSSLREVSAKAEGQLGIVSKRPALIVIDGPGFGLRLNNIMQFFPVRKVMQARRSGNLLAELTRTSA